MKLFSPAKINLFLDITGKRPDGFHEVATVMQALDFGDDIWLEFTGSGYISVETSNVHVPDDSSNLAWRAAELFYESSGIENPGMKLRINKKIPVSSGMAGGSSNAVTVLKALNEYHGSLLSDQYLSNIASKLGSDTVFFLDPGTWIFRGRGEIPERRIATRRYSYLLIMPDFGCETKKVYSELILQLTKNNTEHTLKELELNLKTGSLDNIENCLWNSLKETAFRVYPKLAAMAETIEKETSKKAYLSGSGSTLYLMFINDSAAFKCMKQLQKILQKSANLTIVHTLI